MFPGPRARDKQLSGRMLGWVSPGQWLILNFRPPWEVLESSWGQGS